MVLLKFARRFDGPLKHLQNRICLLPKSTPRRSCVRLCGNEAKFNKIAYYNTDILDCNANDDMLFNQIAWNINEWSEADLKEAAEQVSKTSEITLSIDQVEELDRKSQHLWDDFYSNHKSKGYKDRFGFWVQFPELFHHHGVTSYVPPEKDFDAKLSISREVLTRLRHDESYPGENSTTRILDLGCGIGSTAIPILRKNLNEKMFLYCCDFSPIALDMLRQQPSFDDLRCKTFVCDITADDCNVPFPLESLDYVTIIFVLTACDPKKHASIISKIASYLKPGGAILTRESGIYDMRQLRKKEGTCIGTNRYAKGNGTTCCYFTKEDISKMMEGAGLIEVYNNLSKRIVFNRKSRLKMYRVFAVSKFQKPIKL